MDKKIDKKIRTFFIGVAVIATIFGLCFLFKGVHWASNWFFGIAALFLLIYFIFPKLARFIYNNWMVFVRGFAWVQTRILLTIFFYLVVCPIGLILKLIGKDILSMKFEPEKKSYWNLRERKEIGKEDYLKQY